MAQRAICARYSYSMSTINRILITLVICLPWLG